MKTENPFIIKGYASKELFCDREDELSNLMRNVSNGIDTTLISTRRMGKTGLIFRFFDELDSKKYHPIYVDIYASRSMEDFLKFLVEALLKKFPERSSVGKQFIRLIKGFRPVISYDPLSGNPQVSILYQTPQEKEYTLQGIFNFLEEQPKIIVLAIDEFQQICEYPEKNIEAMLRTYTQHLKNIRFIYCGSNKRMMTNIFSNVKRPFFSSTHYITLQSIERQKYALFIENLFHKNKKIITSEAIEFILDWSKSHTFYTQSLCNITFSLTENKAELDTVKEACLILLKQNEPIFLQYRRLLTPAQWNFLIAVAKEDSVEKITAQHFISKYSIGTPANARRISAALIEKELLLDTQQKKSVTYQVYDVFFSRWLQTEY